MSDEPITLTRRISDWLVRSRWLLMALTIVLTFACVGPFRPDQWQRLFQSQSLKEAGKRFLVGPATQLRFDAAITNLFPPDDPVLTDYLESIRVFGGDETVVVAYTDPELLTPAGLNRLHEFAEKLRSVGGVEKFGDDPPIRQVLSMAEFRWPPEPLDKRPLYEQVEARGVSAEQVKETLLGSELYRNLFVAEDEDHHLTTAIQISLRPKRNDEERVAIVTGIRAIAAANQPFETKVAGGPMLTYDASTYVDEDSRTLGWTSTIVLTIVIGVLFRRVRWVVLPLAVVHVTLLWTKSLLWLFKAQLSMVSTTLTALVTVVGVAGVVQVTARYREEREKAERRDALLRTKVTAGPAVFWASLTTAAGFGSLVITSIVPVRNFSIMLALASTLVFFATAAITPALVLFGRRPSDPKAAPGERWIEHVLHSTMQFSLRHPWFTGIATLVPLVALVAGITRIRAETDFTKNFRRSSPVVSAYTFVEQRFGGIGTFDLEFPAPDELTPEYVDRLRELETKLRENGDLTKVFGLVDVLDALEADKLVKLARNNPFVKPNEATILEGKLKGLSKELPELISLFWLNDAEPPQMRILLRAHEQVPGDVKDRLIAFVERTGREWFESTMTDDETAKVSQPQPVARARPANGLRAAHDFVYWKVRDAMRGKQPPPPSTVRVTGIYTLLNHLVSGLMKDQLKTFLLAAAAVFTIMAIALRSIRLAIVGIVPKLAPILMVLGAMGWLGIPIDMGTPMIASVSMGISVGFSIHYLYRFRQERRAGVPFDEALGNTHRRVGGAMVFSNLALVVGFAVLALSNFIPTVHFSILADVALLGGLVGNLLLLPLLLKLLPV